MEVTPHLSYFTLILWRVGSRFITMTLCGFSSRHNHSNQKWFSGSRSERASSVVRCGECIDIRQCSEVTWMTVDNKSRLYSWISLSLVLISISSLHSVCALHYDLRAYSLTPSRTILSTRHNRSAISIVYRALSSSLSFGNWFHFNENRLATKLASEADASL